MIRLQKEQALYLADEARLNLWIHEHSPITAIGGERQRYDWVQDQKFKEGKSKARGGESQHQKLKAEDIEFFDENGDWLFVPPKIHGRNDHLAIATHRGKLQHIGDKWESLDPKNRWGGNFYHGGDNDLYDPGHFERRD